METLIQFLTITMLPLVLIGLGGFIGSSLFALSPLLGFVGLIAGMYAGYMAFNSIASRLPD